MKVGKYSWLIVVIIGILVVYGSRNISIKVIEQLNEGYEQQNPVTAADLAQYDTAPSEEIPASYGVDPFISATIKGEEAVQLPVTTEQNFIVFEEQLYVTNNQGESWMAIPDNENVSYAQISDYTESLSSNQFYITDQKISIVYGGRGHDNISIITADMETRPYWSVSSISNTATQDLQNGYDDFYIDFVDEGKTGYLAAIRGKGTAEEEILLFWSVNSGVTWDEVFQEDLADEIIRYFDLEREVL